MSNEKLEQAQLDIANQLVTAMNKLAERADKISNAFRTQSDVVNDINNSFEQMENNVTERSESLDDFVQAATKAQEKIEETVEQGGKFVNFVKDMQKGIDELGAGVWTMNALWGNFTRPLENLREGIIKIAQKSKVLNAIGRGFKNLSKNWKDYSEAMRKSNGFLERTVIRLRAVKELTGFLMGGIGNMLKSAVSSIGGIASGIVNIVKTATGMVTKFIKLAVTLPFQIAQSAASIGGKLRQELFEVVIQAGEETKQYFDQTSDIGQGMKRLTGIAAGSLLSFQSVNSEVTKLFGYGAQGAANMIKETSENINAMGHFSEIFAGTITKNSKSIKFLAKAQRALGLSSEDFGYLALDAASNGEGLKSTIAKTAETIQLVAKNSGVDFKRLSINFFKLRKDITNFGHLTNTELSNLTAKMTQMGVKMEDAAALFNKFGTFEDAANASAMLSQTFGMNVDAMDLLQAQNPGEIIDMFRGAMFETGRSFDDLNRHEKSLMAQHTGMSAESLKMIMNFRRMGYTYAESKKMMEDQKPEARQLKALKGLNSSISQFQKTLQFKSPFEAFFSGLTKALAYSPELRKVTQLLSGSYEGIFEFARSLKGDDFKGIVTPIIEVVRVMKSFFSSQGFKTGLKTVLRGIADFVSDIGGYGRAANMDWTAPFKKGVKSLRGIRNKHTKQFFAKEYKKVFSQATNKNLLKKAGISEKRLQKLTLKDTTFIVNKLSNFVSRNPEYRKAYGELGDSLTAASSKYSTHFKPSKKNKKDIAKIAQKFADDMAEAADKNKGQGSKIFDLSGKIMGMIIKGGALFGLGLLKLVNVGLDLLQNNVGGSKNKKSPILDYLQIKPEEYKKLKKGYSKVLSDIFLSKPGEKQSKFTRVAVMFKNVFTGLFKSAFAVVGTLVADSIKQIFGMEIKSDFLSGQQASATLTTLKQMPAAQTSGGKVMPGKNVDYDVLKNIAIQSDDSQKKNIASAIEISQEKEEKLKVFRAFQDYDNNKSTSFKNFHKGMLKNILEDAYSIKKGDNETKIKLISGTKKDKFPDISDTSIIHKLLLNADKVKYGAHNYETLQESLRAAKNTEATKTLLKNIVNLVRNIKLNTDNKYYKNSTQFFNTLRDDLQNTQDKITASKKEQTNDATSDGVNVAKLDGNINIDTPGSYSLNNMTMVEETRKLFNRSMDVIVRNESIDSEVFTSDDDIGMTREEAGEMINVFDKLIESNLSDIELDVVASLDFKKFMYEAKKHIDILGNPHGAYSMRLSNNSYVNPSLGNTTPTMDFDLTGGTVG